MSLQRKENNLRRAQARLDRIQNPPRWKVVSHLKSREFQIDYRREPNRHGRYRTRAYIVRGAKAYSEEMQFIAVTTKDGHVFYVLINYSAENAEDQVFFLNKVDDYDLYALLYAGAEESDDKKKITPEQAAQAAEKANGRVQSGDGADTADTEETAEDGEDATDAQVQAKPVPMSKNSMMLVFGAIALIGVGGAGFFIMKKKNGGGNSKSAMQVEPEYDDDNEITEDEDDMKFYDDQDDEI